MFRTTPLLLLVAVAAFSQVDLSAAETTFTSNGEFNISTCPIYLYGRRYTRLQVLYNNSATGACFIDDSGPTQDCLFMERYNITENLKLSIDSISGNGPASLPNVILAGQCVVILRQSGTEGAPIEYKIESYSVQTVLKPIPLSAFNATHIRFNVTVQGFNVLAVESNIIVKFSSTPYDLSGCRISEPPYGVGHDYVKTLAGKCFNQICNSVTGQFKFVTKCRQEGDCESRCVQVCSVTGPSVVDFNGKVYSIPDRCVYSLSKPRDSSTFEILAGFKERRLVDVPFLDYLKLSLQNPTVTINLEQGGRVRVDGRIVNLTSTPQVFSGVELSIDLRAVSAKLPSNITVSFDGTTAHVTGIGQTNPLEGLCGNPVDPSQNTTLSAVNTSSENAAGCGIQYSAIPKPSLLCDFASAHCITLKSPVFAACHSSIDPQSYTTACTNTLCSYPVVDNLQCQFLESYAEACSRLNVTLGNWRTFLSCLVGNPCLTQYCSPHEFCGLSLTGTVCQCRAGFTLKHKTTNTLGEQAVCTQDSGTLALANCLLKDKNVDSSMLSLNDPSCTGHLNPESHMLEFSFNSTHSCGSEVTTNNTQAIFKNSLSTKNGSANEIINRNTHVFVNFSCLHTAPQLLTTSLRIKQSSVVQQIQSGVLNYTLILNTYNSSELTNAMDPNTEVLLNQKIWVSLVAKGLNKKLVVLVVKSCWATNEPSPTATLQHSLISNGCANPNDKTVQVTVNGLGLFSVFSFNMFEFKGRSSDVYLHCQLELCPAQSFSCIPSCFPGFGRQRRSSWSRSRHAQKNPAFITMVWNK